MKTYWTLLESKKRSSSISQFMFIVFFSILHITAATISPISGEQNVQKIKRGYPSTVVAVDIPDKSVVEMSFPHLKFVNDSSEFHDEDETIAKNGTMISGVAVKYGKRSARHYQITPAQLMMMTGGGGGGGGNPYINTRSYNNRFNRFDNRRNSLESGDTGSSSWGGKWFNQLKRRTSMMMSPMMSYDRQQQMQMFQNQGTAEEPEMAATFLTGGGGGWGQASHYGKGSVNKSAVGLLGFLSLLSLIQNVLNQTSTMQGRRKRDVTGDKMDDDDDDFEFGYDWNDAVAETSLLTPYLLPMLNAVTYAQNGRIAVECTLQPICSANQVLVEKLGDERGKLVGQTISETLSTTLKQAGWKYKTSDWDIGGRVIRAGKSGRNMKKCSDIYKDCNKQLAILPQFSPNGFNLEGLS